MTKLRAITFLLAAAACNQSAPPQTPPSSPAQSAEPTGAATGPIHYETAGPGGSRSSSADPLSPPRAGTGGSP